MSYEDVLYEVADGRATITINRPERLNAFRVQTIRELCEAFEAAADDESVGVIVFTGAGERAFCVGGDVREPTRTPAEKRGLHHLHDRLAVAIRNNGKPIIVRVRGYCIGGGNELNVLCDLTISGSSGRFGQAGPEDRLGAALVGLPADAGGGRREEGARDPLPDPPVQRRGGAGDGAGQRGRARRGARRRGRPLVHRDPAPLPAGPAPGQARPQRRHRPALLGGPARRRAGRAQPRLRARAPGGHRQLPGEAARRLAQVPRRAGPGAGGERGAAPGRPAPRAGARGRGGARGAPPERRPGAGAGRRARGRAPGVVGGGGGGARPRPAGAGDLLAQGLHPAHQPVPGRLLLLHLRARAEATRGPTR